MIHSDPQQHSSSTRRACPVCSGKTAQTGCKPSKLATDGSAWLCRKTLKGDTATQGWHHVKDIDSGSGTAWGLWVNDERQAAWASKRKGSGQSSSPQRITLGGSSKATFATVAAPVKPAIAIEDRMAGYFSLAMESVGKFTPDQIKDLVKRGGTSEQITAAMASALIIPCNAGQTIPVTVPRFKSGGLMPGLLLTCQSHDGLLVGAQIAPTNKEYGKYLWASSEEYSVKLPNGENPATYHKLGTGKTLYLCEGILKPLVTKWRLDNGAIKLDDPGAIMGVAGGQWAGAWQQISAAYNDMGFERIVLLPDAGSISNGDVANRVIALQQVALTAGVKIYHADWGHLALQGDAKKGQDCDERTGTLTARVYETLPSRFLGKALPASHLPAFSKAEQWSDALASGDVRSLNAKAVIGALKGSGYVTISKEIQAGASIIARNPVEARQLFISTKTNCLVWDVAYADSHPNFLQPADLVKVGDTIVPYLHYNLSRQKVGAQIESQYNSDSPELVASMRSPGAVILKAGMGTGKTKLSADLSVRSEKVLIVNSRNELGKQAAAKHGAETHLTANATSVTLRLSTSVASLQEGNREGHLAGLKFSHSKLSDSFGVHGGIVALDEVESVLNDLIYSDLNAKGRKEKWDVLVKLIQSAPRLWAMDAGLKPWTIDLLKTLRGEDVSVFENRQQVANRDLHMMPSREHTLKQIVALAKSGKRIAIATDTAKASRQRLSADGLTETLIRHGVPREKILTVTAESQVCTDNPSFGANPDKLGQYQIVIYTPTWEAGISIDAHNLFDAVFGIFDGTVSADAAIQMLGRVRCDAPRYVWALTSKQFNEVDSTTLAKVADDTTQAALLDGFERECLEPGASPEGLVHQLTDKFEALYDQPNSLTADDKVLAKWVKQQAVYDNASSINYRATIIGSLQLAGYTVKAIPTDNGFSLATMKDYRAVAELLQEQRREEVVKSVSLKSDRASKIQKGSTHTTDENRAMVKFALEHHTKGLVTLETADQVLSFEKTGGMRGITRSHAVLIDKAAATDFILKLARKSHDKTDVNVTYKSDSPILEQARMLFVLESGLADVFRDLVTTGNNGAANPTVTGSQNHTDQHGWLAPDHSLYTAVAAVIRKIQSNSNSAAKFTALFGQKSISTEVQFIRSVNLLVRKLGFDVETKRIKGKSLHRYTTPTVTAKVHTLWADGTINPT